MNDLVSHVLGAILIFAAVFSVLHLFKKPPLDETTERSDPNMR